MAIDDDTHGLEVVPPHALPNALRVCCAGVLTQEEAQTRIGDSYRVLELRPAQCLSDVPDSNRLIDATEIIFARRLEPGGSR